MSIDYRGLLDEIAKVIEVNGEEGGGYLYADLPDYVRVRLAEIADPYSERNQAASAWMAISKHPLIGDLPSLPERGTYAESVRARLDEIAANPSLPEPDATNPDHLRFCADILDPMDGAVDSIYLRARADRLDAARSAERERERDIKAVATALADSHKLVNAQGWIGWAKVAVDALDAVRGGGRGE